MCKACAGHELDCNEFRLWIQLKTNNITKRNPRGKNRRENQKTGQCRNMSKTGPTRSKHEN